jgi:hypothetical protein
VAEIKDAILKSGAAVVIAVPYNYLEYGVYRVISFELIRHLDKFLYDVDDDCVVLAENLDLIIAIKADRSDHLFREAQITSGPSVGLW